jgi:23S rRNA (cytosine1962-C5)-methyltransferase
MRCADGWKDFELIDASGGEKLERWGELLLIRPDPQILWETPRGPDWKRAAARYRRSSSGGGGWEIYSLPRSEWEIGYQDLRFLIRPTGFKHTGLFPEQAVNWEYMAGRIRGANRRVRVLNLFAYTGGATLACAAAGAEVVHVDAAKGMVQWARDNAARSGLAAAPVRWLIDDCKKFIEREIRRNSRYDGIVMDPPSYGRGPGGEVWKIEDGIFSLCSLASQLLSDDALFFLLNSYTAGLSPSVMRYLLAVTAGRRGGTTTCDEIGLPVTAADLALAQGSTAIWSGGTTSIKRD